MDRPDWVHYFLDIATTVSARSPDKQRKVGAVLVREDHSIISTGYNGFVRGSLDEKCAECSEEKHNHMIHAEVNALLTAARHGVPVDGATLFCTLSPCYNCARLLAQAGIKSFIFREIHQKAALSWELSNHNPHETVHNDFYMWNW